MRTLQKITVILFAVVLLTFCGLKIYTRIAVDSIPPTIPCDSETVDVKIGFSESDLLRGVTASDDRDGDLSSEIMIKGITQLITADTAQVTYIVFDSSNNMATCQRTVHYTDYEKPQFSLGQPLVYPVGSTVTLLDRLTAADVIDGDISGKIRIIAQNIYSDTEGDYSVTVQVSNSLGDAETLTLPVSMVQNNYRQSVFLSDYILYLDEGAAFEPRSYISSLSDGSDISDVQISGSVDTGTPGTYDLSYTCKSSTVYLTVVVK